MPGERARARCGLLDEHIARAKKDRAGAAPRVAHAATQIGEVLIRVDDITLGGLSRHVIIPTVVEGDPEPAKPFRSGNLWPPHG
jgi:hypothetical protein